MFLWKKYTPKKTEGSAGTIGIARMKTNTIYKRTYNRALGIIAGMAAGDDPGSETELARALGVSRTTVRAVLEGLATAGILVGAGRARRVGRRPAEDDAYPEFETESVAAVVEKRFMEWVLHGDCRSGQQINSLELGRQLGVSTAALREYLGHFSHFGLLEKRPSGAWVFQGFTREFALELSEVRELFELRSAERFIGHAPDDPAWQKLEQVRRQHIALRREIDKRYTDFSALDERFHRLINDASENRFVRQFYDVISMVFHYHYQWNKADERERNAVAIDEHLAYIAALQSRDPEATLATCCAHMKTARATLLLSIDRFDAQGAGGRPALVPVG